MVSLGARTFSKQAEGTNAAAVAVPISKPCLWNFPGFPADFWVVCENKDGWNLKKKGAIRKRKIRPARSPTEPKIKVIYEGVYWKKKDGNTPKMKQPLRQLMSTRKNWRFPGVLYFQMSSALKCNVGKIKRTTYRKFTGPQKSRVAKASMPLIFHDQKSSAYNNGLRWGKLEPWFCSISRNRSWFWERSN